jgi:N-acetylglucosaminyldiphosphoundecaprenol N-acetyl-beta-D-mannosaminyltransferase
MRTERRPSAIPDYGRDVHGLLGLPVDAVDLGGALRRIRRAAEQGSRCFLSTPNVNFVVASRTDDAFRESVAHSDLSLADGMPLVWLARVLAVPIPERVAGASVFEALAAVAGARPLSVYFFGGDPGAAAAAAARLDGARLVSAGHGFPGFGSVEDMSREEIIAHINAAQPDLLVVALGARKGQAWIERNRQRLAVPVISHLGAVVDFAAGRRSRAPRWVQRSGLEWLWRIKEDPALARRYLYDALALLGLVLSRALPGALYASWQHARPAAALPARLERVESETVYRVRLAGAWTRSNAAPLRRCLAEASAACKDVQLDLERVTYLDSAVLGLFMLLAGHQHSQGRRLAIAPLPRRIRRLFDFSCAEYLYREA